MFRTTAVRSLPRSLNSLNAGVVRSSLANNSFRAAFRTVARPQQTSGALALALRQPVQKSLVRYQSSSSTTTKYGLNSEAEASYGAQKIGAHPEMVSASSSMHPVIKGEIGVEEGEKEVDMTAGIKSDFV